LKSSIKELTGLILTLAEVGFLQAQGQRKAPNILFIMSDDHTSQAINAYGGYLGK